MVDKRSFFRHPRRIILIATILVTVLATSSIYAYYRSLSPQAGPRASIISGPLEFSIELDKTEYLDNENVSVTMMMTNVANVTVEVSWFKVRWWGDKIAYFDYSIFDANGTEVFRRFLGVGAEAVILRETLSPGQQLLDKHNWTQTTGNPEFEKLPRGAYSIKASTTEFFLKVGDQESMTTLETPSISFAMVYWLG